MPPEDGVSYTLREVVIEINRRLDALDSKTAGRFDALDARIDLVLKDFNGFERRVALHEQLGGHPNGVERLTAVEHDVRGLMSSQLQRQAVEDYLKQATVDAAAERERRAAAARWAIGVGLTLVLELGTILLKVFGVLG